MTAAAILRATRIYSGLPPLCVRRLARAMWSRATPATSSSSSWPVALRRPRASRSAGSARCSSAKVYRARWALAVYPRDGLDQATLARAADRALYGAKHAGKNTYAFA